MMEIRRPLVVALFAFLAGLLPALRFSPSPLLIAVAFLAVTLALSVAFSRHLAFTDTRYGFLLRELFLLQFVALGAFAGALGSADAATDCRALLKDGQRLEVRGVVGAAHRENAVQEKAPLLPLEAVIGGSAGGKNACTGEIRFRVPPGTHDMPVGSRIVASGVWRAFSGPDTSSGWPRDPRFYGFFLPSSIVPDASPSISPSLWLTLRNQTVLRIERIFPDQTALVEALLLGRREYVDPDIINRYTRSGLTHLLAISGSHVALIAGALLLLGSALRLPRRWVVLSTVIVTWIYLFVIGMPPSAVRSGVMLSLALLAVLLQRPSATSAIVAAAAFVILAFSPLAILDPGFQLSFAGVLGLVYLRGPILRLTPEIMRRHEVARWLTDACVMGIGAFIVTAPIVAHHFGTIAPISILAGIPAIPLTSLALIGVSMALAVDPVLPLVARWIAAGTTVCLKLLDRIADIAANIPYGNGAVASPPWWTWSIAVMVGLLSVYLVRPRSTRARWLIGSGAVIAAALLRPLFLNAGEHGGMEVHFIDVGQGEAIAIRTPAGRWVLVDAGPASGGFDAGERRVLPFLRAHGARRIEAFVLTHPDLDHIGGARAVLEGLPVLNVFEPGQAVGKESYLDLLQAVDLHQTNWRAARAGRSLELDGVRIDFLWPDPDVVDAFADANQISAVMRLTFGDFILLLTGDAGTDVEQLLARRHGELLRSDILKLGHHGSSTSSDSVFLDQVSPGLAVVSAGRRNRYGHPHQSVMDQLSARGIPVARTDEDGTVSLHIPEGGLTWDRR